MTTLAMLATSPEFTSHINEHFCLRDNVIYYAYKDFGVPLEHIVAILTQQQTLIKPSVSKLVEALTTDILSWREMTKPTLLGELFKHTDALLETGQLNVSLLFHYKYTFNPKNELRIYYPDASFTLEAYLGTPVTSHVITKMVYDLNDSLARHRRITGRLPVIEVKRTTKHVNGKLKGVSYFSLINLYNALLGTGKPDSALSI